MHPLTDTQDLSPICGVPNLVNEMRIAIEDIIPRGLRIDRPTVPQNSRLGGNQRRSQKGVCSYRN